MYPFTPDQHLAEVRRRHEELRRDAQRLRQFRAAAGSRPRLRDRYRKRHRQR